MGWSRLLPARPARTPILSDHPAAIDRRDRAEIAAAARAKRDEIEARRRREHRLAFEARLAASLTPGEPVEDRRFWWEKL